MWGASVSASPGQSTTERPTAAVSPPRRSGLGVAASWTLTALACLLVWFALLAPDQLGRLSPGAFLRIPLEALVLVGAAVLLPLRPRRVVAVVAGVVLGLLAIVKILDMGFVAAI